METLNPQVRPQVRLRHAGTVAATALGASLLLLGAFGVAAAAEGGKPLATELTGAVEVPGPGDPDGTGAAQFRLNPGQTEACYDLTASKIATPTAAHIHRGAKGAAGPVVVTLQTPTGGKVTACAPVTKELAKELIQTPAAFYVNVHNAEFPAGAIRGQLSQSPPGPKTVKSPN